MGSAMPTNQRGVDVDTIRIGAGAPGVAGTAIEARGLCKTYHTSPPVVALRGVDLDVAVGERLVISGRSGAGKSTLLNILGLLDTPTAGTYTLLGHDTATTNDSRRNRLRAQALGFVFQENHILGHRTAAENVDIKLSISRVPHADRAALIDQALEQVGLAHRRDARARLLSGGEKQRLAVARAMVDHPQVLLADEPTGNLDDDNAQQVLELFDNHAAHGVAVIVISHDMRLTTWADRALRLVDGRLAGPSTESAPTGALDGAS
jgi:putative ABC transport system ATP-binding protein